MALLINQTEAQIKSHSQLYTVYKSDFKYIYRKIKNEPVEKNTSNLRLLKSKVVYLLY